MGYITNNSFTAAEKDLLELILQYDFAEKDMAVKQLNELKSRDIVRDYSPYYKIMEFRTDETESGYSGMRMIAALQILHSDESAPTMFYLYEKDENVFEYEIFNADSSEMDMQKIVIGTQMFSTDVLL